ncbi:MAG: PmoA family protein [Prolixibacteraceae bacterium]|nr:PmoA family protein [Prolixibacteraceae bacterium]
MNRVFFLLTGLIILLGFANCSKNSNTITLEVGSTGYESQDIPTSADIQLPAEFQGVPEENIVVTLKSGDGSHKDIPGQVTVSPDGSHKLWWIIPETNKDRSVKWKATLQKSSEAGTPAFRWEDTPGRHLDLVLNNKKVFRYEYELDSVFKKGETLTAHNRVFYHIYDLEGKDFITNGPEEGVWSHHRGIMIGWRKVDFRDQQLSFWGMEDLTVQKHIKFTRLTAGPVVSVVESLIQWNDSTGTTIIEEIRTATIYNQPPPAIALLDFSSTMKAVAGPVKLDGDPEHAGVQFRAHNDVAEGLPGSVKPTFWFHQDNIDPKNDYDLPWAGVTYGLRNKMYSVADLNHPANPGPGIWSAYRDYARFGPYFKYELGANETLTVNYRFWFSESDMPEREIISSKYDAYRNPPVTKVK